MKTLKPRSFLLFTLLSLAFLTKALPADSTRTSIKRAPYRASTTKQNDILHTRLDVKFDWTKSQMVGKASITGKPHINPTSKLYLDARGMAVQSVEVFDVTASKVQPNIKPASPEMSGSKKLNSTYKYENDSIKINLGREFTSEEKYLIKINYVAKPNELKKGGSDAISDDKGLFFINPKGEDKTKMPQIWTQGETQANSAWFPTIDSPNEKMTSEIYMTVDSKYTTLSNGALTDSKKNADGTRTDHWKMDLPHSAYLVMMAVGEFKKVTDVPWNGKEISYYIEKEYEPYAKAIFGNTKEMIDFYSRVLGTPYPWAKYSQIVVRDYVSGAMENTSATLHGDFMVYQTAREMVDGKKGEAVIAHELFHQWFGDLVTAESWSNLPLNESFATYGEYLWEEYKNGRDAADAHSFQSRMGYYSAARQKQVNMIRYDYQNKEDMFDAWSYNKGGQIIHMLRKYVGDKAFFAGLKLYLERNRFKSAEIHDLRLAFEEVSGEDLNWFFNQWFLAKGHPELSIEKSYDATNKTLKLSVKQTQNLQEMPLYNIPVEIDIYSNGKKEGHRIVIDREEQEFNFTCASKPDLVHFDAERQLLGIKSYSKTTEEMIVLYKNGGLYMDRLEALSNLKEKITEPEVYNLFLYALENDKWYELRINAMDALDKDATTKENEIRPLVLKIAQQDKNTNVRARAITFLSEHYSGAALAELYKKACDEQSYAIVAAALKAIVKTDPNFALAKAKGLEAENNEKVFEALSVVYAKAGLDEKSSYFVKSKAIFSGYGYLTYIYYYSAFLKQCERPQTFEAAAMVFAEIIKTGNDYVKKETRKAYKESILDAVDKKQEQTKNSSTVEKVKEWEETKVRIENVFKTL